VSRTIRRSAGAVDAVDAVDALDAVDAVDADVADAEVDGLTATSLPDGAGRARR
jgi:hypothetical protein